MVGGGWGWIAVVGGGGDWAGVVLRTHYLEVVVDGELADGLGEVETGLKEGEEGERERCETYDDDDD